ncbi:MAG: DegT/DnrJ/EryC1/StrS aminotransferase family protein [Calditrichaeota bacterium]|nr:DegT/DnrJ/EryC1/StrS aminotransferase family protein [Calditrichota bacterium]
MHWCRRGTTAMAWACKAASLARPDVGSPEVILPATACSTLPAGVLLAGGRIRFADVNLNDALPDWTTIEHALTPNTVAVLFIHMFGNTAALDDLQRKLTSRGLVLIEDVAQAFGGHLPNGDPVGSAGDLVIHGFTDNKILESGGGALVVRRSDLLEPVLEAKEMLPKPKPMAREDYQRFDRSYQSFYSGLVELVRMAPGARPHRSYEDMIPHWGEWFLQGEPPGLRLDYERRRLDSEIAHRLMMAGVYEDRVGTSFGRPLSHPGISGNCWRWSMLLNEGLSQESVIAALRRRGIPSTDLYWPLDTLLGDGPECKVARELGRRVINLPVDRSATPELAVEVAKVLAAQV